MRRTRRTRKTRKQYVDKRYQTNLQWNQMMKEINANLEEVCMHTLLRPFSDLRGQELSYEISSFGTNFTNPHVCAFKFLSFS